VIIKADPCSEEKAGKKKFSKEMVPGKKARGRILILKINLP